MCFGVTFGSGKRWHVLGLESRMAVSIVNVVMALRAFRRMGGGFCIKTFGLILIICLVLSPRRLSFDVDRTG